jgi:hypothetical protein
MRYALFVHVANCDGVVQGNYESEIRAYTTHLDKLYTLCTECEMNLRRKLRADNDMLRNMYGSGAAPSASIVSTTRTHRSPMLPHKNVDGAGRLCTAAHVFNCVMHVWLLCADLRAMIVDARVTWTPTSGDGSKAEVML